MEIWHSLDRTATLLTILGFSFSVFKRVARWVGLYIEVETDKSHELTANGKLVTCYRVNVTQFDIL